MTRSRRGLSAFLWCALLMISAVPLANATTFKRQATIVDLLNHAELIIHGRVINLTDGIDQRGIPYTEVTIRVAETIKGQASGDYTFRQFGLLKPRKMDSGLTNLMVTPASWATFTKGEDTILFLHKSAAWTGLRTTAGLGQGKFNLQIAGAINQVNNSGLFKNVYVDQSVLGDTEKRVMATKKGPVNAKGFMSLVKQAVDGRWVEEGKMRNEK
jgi:hypothetical protein